MTRIRQRCCYLGVGRYVATSQLFRRLALALLPSVVLSLSGCGGSGRLPVSGTVTVDGKPLPEASICFLPEGDTKSPSVGGKIRDGRFEIPSDQGLQPGNYRVEITASRASGRKAFIDSLNKTVDLKSQYLPARYNEQSELTAVIAEGVQPQLEYALTLP